MLLFSVVYVVQVNSVPRPSPKVTIIVNVVIIITMIIITIAIIIITMIIIIIAIIVFFLWRLISHDISA
jgi:hypothetical protein